MAGGIVITNNFPKLKDDDMADLEKYTEDLTDALTTELDGFNTAIGAIVNNLNKSIRDLRKDISENTTDLEDTKSFIANSMKTLSVEGTSIHVSDSADYPCTLKVEGKSEQVQTEQGKNLLPINIYEFESNVSKSYAQKIFLKKDVSYKFSYKTEGTNIRTFVKNEGGITIAGSIYSGATINVENDGVYTFTSDRSTVEVVKAGRVYDIQLEEGTVATEFEPFTPDSPSPEYPSEIENVSGDLEIKVVGKNLFNINDKGMNKVNCSEVLIDGNSIAITSINVATTSRLDFPINYPVNKPLGISFDATIISEDLLSENAVRTYFRKDSQTYGIIELTKNNLKNHYSSKINAVPEKDIKFWLYVKSVAKQGTVKVKFENIQIEVGETATDYEPYKEQVVTFPLGTQKLMQGGYLGENGVVNKRKQVVLTGNETWNTDTTRKVFYTTLENSYSSNIQNSTGRSLCNFYKEYGSTLWNDTDLEIECGYLINYGSFDVRDLRFTDVTEFKNWLAEQYTNGTPVIVEYELEEEETTPYTEEQRTAYNALQALKTYRTITNISNNQDTNMELTYKMDLQTQIAGGGSSA